MAREQGAESRAPEELPSRKQGAGRWGPEEQWSREQATRHRAREQGTGGVEKQGVGEASEEQGLHASSKLDKLN